MITKKSFIGEIIEKHPETIPVLGKYQLGCLGCPMAGPETIADAAQVHGVDLDSLIKDLNQAINEKNK
jgi:hybrid cluster-associated redox disulfide protein